MTEYQEMLVRMKQSVNDVHRYVKALGRRNTATMTSEERARCDVEYDQALREFLDLRSRYEVALSNAAQSGLTDRM